MIGKFYPPHAGHHLLDQHRGRVQRAGHRPRAVPRGRVDPARRPAGVAARGARRPNGTCTFHGVIDDHPVDFADAAIWDLHEAVFRAGLAAVTEEPVTAVFSSEDYGDELARRARCRRRAGRRRPRHGAGQRHRGARRPGGALGATSPPPVRAWFARRVVVVGAESTGTTTVSRALADALRARGRRRTGSRSGCPEQPPSDSRSAKLAADRAAARSLAGDPAARDGGARPGAPTR